MNILKSLLADHKMIINLLKTMDVDNPRLSSIRKTLGRVLTSHAGFEDKILSSCDHASLQLHEAIPREISNEHKDIETLMQLILHYDLADKKPLQHLISQHRIILETHFKKEEDIWFPSLAKHTKNADLSRLFYEK
ncbi:hypothetical protein BVX98_06155 [bacterium F11]|nr:hypothetical protein BVX98_06155 [bacterium F11]